MKVGENNEPFYSASKALRKARRLGLLCPDDLMKLAVVRGLRYYDGLNQGAEWKKDDRFQISANEFTNAELAIALLSPDWPDDDGSAVQVRQRIASAVLSAADVDPIDLAQLASQEKCEPILRWISTCGAEVEPENPFWRVLLEQLPVVEKPERAPHPTRFFEMTGLTRQGVGIRKRWLRLLVK
ncbi:MAG: hypothetical protein P1U89_27230 [Verrucomicrobiales bacterium]|nr:hypothetical protein [Verrucomicrobiales bacterium]